MDNDQGKMDGWKSDVAYKSSLTCLVENRMYAGPGSKRKKEKAMLNNTVQCCTLLHG